MIPFDEMNTMTNTLTTAINDLYQAHLMQNPTAKGELEQIAHNLAARSDDPHEVVATATDLLSTYHEPASVSYLAAVAGKANEIGRELANTDSLTGVHNHRSFTQKLTEAVNLAG